MNKPPNPYTSLPSAIDAEEALIGSVLVDPAIWPEVKHIEPSEFYWHGNGWLWASFGQLADAGQPIDSLTLSAHMNGQLNELGGPAYLTKLITRTPTPYNAAAYAGLVREAAVRRTIIAGAGDLAKLAFDHNQPIDGVRRVLAEIGGGLDNGSGEFETVQSAASRTWDNVSDPEGYAAKLLSTGLGAVDRAIGGLNEQTLNVIMGRPGIGKTAFLNQVADLTTERGLTVVYFPFEMSTEQTIERMAARRARVSLLRIRQNKATPDERQRLLDWIGLLAKRKTLYLDDRPKTTGDLAAKCHKLAARIGKIDLILMDHLRLALDKGDNETHRLGAISWSLKQLAKSLNTRVLVGAQLNRALEARGKDDRRPTLADLRDSGEIEENADNVLGLYRARYYDPQADAVTEFGVEKCRDGQRGAVAKMVFVEHCMSFEPVDWAER